MDPNLGLPVHLREWPNDHRQAGAAIAPETGWDGVTKRTARLALMHLTCPRADTHFA